MKKCSRSTARSTTWSKVAATALACWVAASRVESCGAGGACAGGVCAGAVCASEVCAGEVCAGEVSAGRVWEYTSVAPQQTRESARSANGERNIFVCFISSMMRDLGCELKHDVQYRLEICGMAVSQGGLELNFFRGANRRFVQSMAETVHHFHDANLPGG